MSAITKERFYHVSEILFQQLLAVFVLLILWELFKSDAFGVTQQKTWHIVLCVLGFALCMAEGVQIYRKESIVTFGNTRKDKVTAHLAVMLLGFLCVTVGVSLKINEKIAANRSHFQSTHAILGLSAWIITFVALVGGSILNMLQIGMTRVLKIFHIFFGVTAYAIGVIALCYGLKYLVGSGRAWIALVVMLILYVAYSLIGPCISLFNHLFRK